MFVNLIEERRRDVIDITKKHPGKIPVSMPITLASLYV